jgi:hypothetical protein
VQFQAGRSGQMMAVKSMASMSKDGVVEKLVLPG